MLNNQLIPVKPATTWVTYYKIVWFIAGVGLFSQFILPYVGYKSLGSVYLLAILTVSVLSTRGPILFTAIISALSWNYFFMPPRFTFVVSSQEDIMTLLIFFVTAIVAGFLATKIKNQEENLQVRQERMNWLYDLSKVLAGADSIKEIKSIFKSIVENQFDANIEISIGQENNVNHKNDASASANKESSLTFPLKGKTKTLGTVVLHPKNSQKTLTEDERNYLDTVIAQIAIAIERFNFSESVLETKFLQESEKIHQTLLNSVSHELRIPITAIIGTATALQDENIVRQQDARLALTSELVRSSLRLERVVENLLDVSRLEKDTLKLKKEWFEISELIEEAKNNLKDHSLEHSILVTGDTSLVMEGDFKLLEHALRNLILNATKYSPKNSEIEIRVNVQNDFIKISVIDEGKGFPPELSQHLFEKFYRVPGTPAGGLGLGLSIVKNIIELHKGEVAAFNRSEIDSKSGAIFEIKLPNNAQPETLKGVVNASEY